MAQGGFDPLNQYVTNGTDASWYQSNYVAGDTTAGNSWGYTGNYPLYPLPAPEPEIGSWQGVNIVHTSVEENRMVRQDVWLFKMIAVDNVTYEVLAEGSVFARSENSANIKFALDNKIDPDAIGDTVDFFITYKSQLREPLDESKIQKVQVVE